MKKKIFLPLWGPFCYVFLIMGGFMVGFVFGLAPLPTKISADAHVTRSVLKYTDLNITELLPKTIWNKLNPPLKIERWGLRLLPYKYTIEHEKGVNNIADYLSRHPVMTRDNKSIVEEYVNFIQNSSKPRAVDMKLLDIISGPSHVQRNM